MCSDSIVSILDRHDTFRLRFCDILCDIFRQSCCRYVLHIDVSLPYHEKLSIIRDNILIGLSHATVAVSKLRAMMIRMIGQWLRKSLATWLMHRAFTWSLTAEVQLTCMDLMSLNQFIQCRLFFRVWDVRSNIILSDQLRYAFLYPP